MRHNQPMQSKPQDAEPFVQIPLDIEHSTTTSINQTSQRLKKWLTIIICIIVVGTGQSIARLLDTYYYLHTNNDRRYGVWTQSLVQVVGFPLLILPFFIVLLFSSNKQNQLLVTSKGTSFIQFAIIYLIISITMGCQATLSTSKKTIPYKIFTLIYTTQLFFTPVFSICFNKIKFNRWMIVSLFFAILTGSFTLYALSGGSPVYNGKKYYNPGTWTALSAAFLFSLLLCQIRRVFEDLFSVCRGSTNRKRPSFAVVVELVIFSCFFATVFYVAAVLISGEHHDIKREMDRFSKGEIAYVRTMVGQAAAWQIYWVGIVGIVFVVSAVFSNVISVCTWPIVGLLSPIIYYMDDEYDILSATALATAALSVASYFYLIHKEKSDGDNDTS